MKAGTGAQRHFSDGFHAEWQQLRLWKQKTFTKERMAETALFVSTASVLGYVVWWAAKAAENYTILGLG